VSSPPEAAGTDPLGVSLDDATKLDGSRGTYSTVLSGEGRQPIVREWVRFRPVGCFGDPFVDAARSLILLDTYGWPAAFRMHRDGLYIAPNLDTSAWFHRSSLHSEWLLIDHECPVAERGLLGVSGRVWDLDRRLLVSGSAQLYCIPPPSS
jgi:acyl-CoA thioesterase